MTKLKPEVIDPFSVAFEFIEERIKLNFKSVTPEMTRKLELLEVLLIGFLDHGMDMNLFDKMEKELRLSGAYRSPAFRTIN